MALIPISVSDFSIDKGRHPSQMVNATQPFSWIEYFDITIQSKSNKTLVATLIFFLYQMKIKLKKSFHQKILSLRRMEVLV